MKKLTLFFFVSVSFYCFGQQIIVDYDLLNSSDSILIQPYTSCNDADCEYIANQAKENLYLLGYLNASVIEFYKGGKKIYQIHSGNQYKVVKLQFKDVPDSIISKYLEFLQPGAPYSQVKLTEFYNDVLKYYLNTGYPFARVGMESFEFIGTGIVGFIVVNKGPLTVFSKIIDASGYYKSNWLMKQAGVQEGEPFSESKIQSCIDKLKYYGISQINTYELRQDNGEAIVMLHLSSPESGKFDGMAGLQQDPKTREFLLTGYLNLFLPNMFGSLKQLGIDWKKLRRDTQNLEASFKYPAFLNSKLELDMNFHLFKQDSLFLNRSMQAVLYRPFRSGLSVGLGLTLERTGLLNHISYDQGQLENIDNKVTYLNLLAHYENEQSGFSIGIDMGKKYIIENNSVSVLTYDSYPKQFYQFKLHGMFHYKNQIKGNWYWVQKYSAGMYFSEYQFDNDRFRPGGVNSLRGYLDREFFADQFLLMQSEFRYYSTKSTYFNFFYDAGILSRIETSNKLMGFGLGMNVETGKKGWLQCYMALGKREKNKIDISQTLIHVGYVAKF